MDIEKIMNKLRQIGDDRSASAMLAIEYIRNEKTKAEQERDQYEKLCKSQEFELGMRYKRMVDLEQKEIALIRDNESLRAQLKAQEDELNTRRELMGNVDWQLVKSTLDGAIADKQEIESLRTQLKAAECQEPIGFIHTSSDIPKGAYYGVLNAQDAKFHKGYDVPVYLAPIPAQKSPVVAVPDGWKLVPKIPTTEMLMACAEAAPTLGAKTSPDGTWTQWAPNARWKAMVDAAPIASPSPRITEQDAREIAEAYAEYSHNFTSWLKFEGRALLDKLNNTDSVGG